MPDNIYPDLSNDKFDIQYARLLGLSSDLRASFGVVEEITGSSSPPPIFPPIETPSDVDTYPDTGTGRFGVATEDDTAGQNRSFDLAGAYSFALTQLGNNQFLVDPTNGLYQLGAVPIPGSDSGLSYTYLEIDDTTNKITLQAAEGIVLPGYGYGNHSGTETFFLAVDAGGNLIEVSAAAGYTNLTQFVDQNPWKVFYSDGNGDVQELSIGASGDVLTSNGASSVPSWETPATGGGTVTDFIFTDANGFDGTVTSSTTTPTLTLTTTLTAGSVFFAGASGAINEDNSNFFFDNGNNRLGIGTNSFAGAATRLEVVDNSLAGASMVKLTSASIAASGNAHKLLEVLPSGANTNAGSTTYGIYVENTHTGSSSTNISVAGISSGGSSNIGVYGSGDVGVSGISSSGTGVSADSTSGRALIAQSSAGLPGRFVAFPSSTNTVVEVVRLNRQSSGTGASGIGASLTYYLETASGGTSEQLANELISKYTDNVFASRTAQWIVTGYTDADLHNQLVLAGPQSTLLSRDAATNQTGERFSVVGTYKALTESTATAFVRVNIPSGTATGGEILITVEANDATDYQSRTLRFIWSAVNKAGTITATVQTPEEVVALSTGTLTVAIDTNDAGSGNLDFRADAASSLTQSILRCSYQVFKNIGTGAITPQ